MFSTWIILTDGPIFVWEERKGDLPGSNVPLFLCECVWARGEWGEGRVSWRGQCCVQCHAQSLSSPFLPNKICLNQMYFLELYTDVLLCAIRYDICDTRSMTNR